jgi:hypothetical protein
VSYELRAYEKGKRGKLRRVQGLTIQENDPHVMAVEFWRLSHAASGPYVLEVRDLATARGPLAPLITYEELVLRAQRATAKEQHA